MDNKTLDSSHSSGLTLAHHVRQCLDDYFAHLDGHEPANLYELVLNEVEKPLIEIVLKQAHFNQSRAAEILGISRSTLRKKIALFGIG
ncbi:MAG: Fis family transcriptional regulator [Methylomonas sp.]|nr:Fis family transcriptional regulator [Methylomonas sp.]PPD20891.1 MAG: Fis family transcriptional regulator [Methylomonas sp.]PPD25608.1 MAG: Fis family transcriptional regulator [Methylomonas sp.]PPD36609.1 MAG: Fis family transcriptional regulator [Methylomonas sp.]PPD39922.1 MAG: Fis family transcriptional regulator [Methylomonas sp.]